MAQSQERIIPCLPQPGSGCPWAALPGCRGQKDGSHPLRHCKSSTSRVSGGGAFNIRPGSHLPVAVGHWSVLPFPREGRASPLPAQRWVAASAKRCSWWPVFLAAAFSLAKPSIHPFSTLGTGHGVVRDAWVFQDAASVTCFHLSPKSLHCREGQSCQREMGDGLPEQVGALVEVPGDCKAQHAVSADAPPASHSLRLRGQ